MRAYLGGMTWAILLAMLGLMAVSLLSIHAAESADPKDLSGYTFRQTVYIVVALGAFVAASLTPHQRVGRWAYVLYGLNLSLLVLVLFLPETRGSRRWINLKVFNIQPSELMKVTYIITLATYLKSRENYRRLWGLLPPLLLTLVPAALILKEPDLGTTLLLFPTLFFMLFMAGARMRHLVATLAVAAIVIFAPVPKRLPDAAAATTDPLVYGSVVVGGSRYELKALPLPVIKDHQRNRIEGWLRQSDDRVAANEGFQLQQSLLVLGSGGLAGRHGDPAMMHYINVLPDDHTDFIFAVIGGRSGLVGCIGVMLLYLAIFICGVEIASLTQDAFGRMLAIGVLSLLFVQIFINVGMTMGVMPITGMTLPMISYGGSSMIANAVALGLLVNVGRRRPILLGRKPFDPDARAPEKEADVSRPLPQAKWPKKKWGR